MVALRILRLLLRTAETSFFEKRLSLQQTFNADSLVLVLAVGAGIDRGRLKLGLDHGFSVGGLRSNKAKILPLVLIRQIVEVKYVLVL
jgi:hypothetical protein